MKTYELLVSQQLTFKIKVEAESQEEAEELVEGGDYDEDSVDMSIKTGSIEVIECNEVKN